MVKNYTAAAQSRLTIWVDQEAPELASAEVSIIVESLTATPVVVERSMWWRATPAGEWIEAHNNRARDDDGGALAGGRRRIRRPGRREHLRARGQHRPRPPPR